MSFAVELLEALKDIRDLAAQRGGSTPPNVLLAKIENLAVRVLAKHGGKSWSSGGVK